MVKMQPRTISVMRRDSTQNDGHGDAQKAHSNDTEENTFHHDEPRHRI